ncbi:MAG: metal ABC transporter permease [Planctomycetota bacterium]
MTALFPSVALPLAAFDLHIDGWTIAVGAMCAVSCTLVGVFLVLRRMSMMGDAISHAILPGLAAAFLISGERSSLTMFIGAAAAGVLTALLVEWVRGAGKVDEGASIGVVFTALFAIGLVMIVQAADAVDLDPGCVLYGLLEFTPLSTVPLLGIDVPRAALPLGIMLVLNTAFVLVFYKELKLTSFDPALADTLGFRSGLMHYALMTLVAATAVASFEAVGNILVVAVLIVPAAAASMLTDRLPRLIAIAVLVAIGAAALGHLSAMWIPAAFGYKSVSSAAMMAVATGVFFAAAVLFGPRRGLVSKLYHRTALSLRIAREDVLTRLYRGDEQSREIPMEPMGPLTSRLVYGRLRRDGLLATDELALTKNGRSQAADLIRSHRLWETYLEQNADLPPGHVHYSAERLEHAIDAELQAELDAEVGTPAVDPHGRKIPREQGASS